NRANDTFFCLNHHLNYAPNDFLLKFLDKIKNQRSEYKPYWSEIRSLRKSKHDHYLHTIPFCDLKTFDIVLKALPDNSILQVGNSSAIRYVQLFDLKPSIEVFCNRGTSGIDGSTSTAVGSAVVSQKQTTLITGDLSFFYDSNGLWNDHIPANFRIIVINNGGGGIFRILPGHKNTENFDTYFETTHNLSANHLSEMYNFEYFKAEKASELNEVLGGFFKASDKPKILEVITPRTTNDEILLNYFNYIK
ncbi:MAG: 2-succinyl-5-enolpyruvyl-6-hydroxy-3-cyclohexene-1-carboxylate synthase, partial [Bacteroidia bacterium]|nr:2-succinyl-5-enolpyruvyl-6-hydroxy-3-cyclohexene-1-carboxylate synthase [Bacteroidia bacterium]